MLEAIQPGENGKVKGVGGGGGRGGGGGDRKP